MMLARVVILSLLAGFASTASSCNYSAKPASACNRDNVTPKEYSMTDEHKNAILKKHNDLRQKAASGNEERGDPGPQPAAKDMPNLQWDDELAKKAQTWADQCIWNHDDNSCRDVERFKVGQNIAYRDWSAPINETGAAIRIQDMIQSWYDEVAIFPNTEVSSFQSLATPKGEIAHYTQMVWAKTTLVGCGAINYKSSATFYRIFLVCDYGPRGNVSPLPVYETK